MKKFLLLSFLLLGSIQIYAQTINQNQQNVNINFDNLPVIEKPVYITKYRTVYIDKPQPKRIAKNVGKPVLLLGYLWVYPYDLGDFIQNPTDVINNINAVAPFNRSTWRVPTPDELAVMEANASLVGLGDGIYMSTAHKGTLRLVSTGPTHTEIQEQLQAELLEEQQKRQEKELWEYNKRNDTGVDINGTIWATRNSRGSISSSFSIDFDNAPDSEGSWFRNPEVSGTKNYRGEKWYEYKSMPSGWEVPSVKDFEKLFQQGGVYDLENSCWRLGDIILPAAGELYEKGGGISYDSYKSGRNCGYYVCKDGYFVFNLEKKSFGSYGPKIRGPHDYSIYEVSWKLRLIKKKNYNKYFDK